MLRPVGMSIETLHDTDACPCEVFLRADVKLCFQEVHVL